MASRAKHSLEFVIQDQIESMNYVQDWDLKRNCQTAVTAVWELSNEEVSQVKLNNFWLLFWTKAAPILEILMKKTETAILKWKFSNWNYCCLRIVKWRGEPIDVKCFLTIVLDEGSSNRRDINVKGWNCELELKVLKLQWLLFDNCQFKRRWLRSWIDWGEILWFRYLFWHSL